MKSDKKLTHGGARTGAGRKKTVEHEAKTRPVRLTDIHWAKFRKIGGAEWLRNYLDTIEN